jgi:hypothetical protein
METYLCRINLFYFKIVFSQQIKGKKARDALISSSVLFLLLLYVTLKCLNAINNKSQCTIFLNNGQWEL